MEEVILSAPTSEEESPKLSCMSHCKPNLSLDHRNGMKEERNDTMFTPEVPGEETDKWNSLSDLKQDISYEMRETSNLKHFQLQFEKLEQEKTFFKEEQKRHKANKCPTCLKVFQTSSKLKRHQLVHTGEKPFQCQICLKAFSELSNVRKHQKVHTGEKPFECQICLKLFSTSSQLKTHRRVHTGEKPFQCQICLKSFSESSSLRKHQKVHTGEKPFRCQICLKLFSTSPELKIHRRVHTAS
ncbi:zinc finger protein 239 [Biomphalaria pfeifferi]|uniref:Zinc finger protein 239 n=1 Tax=Biomphalaria pfeifferi TaxID=112525 RepID=A0AAD8C451_BIOPF|nr:zinc finger protein 239 [Biomphalaria pfeifferi]